MCVSIDLESLAVRSLYDLITKDDNNRFVSFKQIEEYGFVIKEYFEKINVECAFTLSRIEKINFFLENENFFMEKTVGGVVGIELKKNISKRRLAETFARKICIDLLLAYSKNPFDGKDY